jgi:hypothetical protein
MTLNISKPYRPPRPSTGIALLLFFTSNVFPYDQGEMKCQEVVEGWPYTELILLAKYN